MKAIIFIIIYLLIPVFISIGRILRKLLIKAIQQKMRRGRNTRRRANEKPLRTPLATTISRSVRTVIKYRNLRWVLIEKDDKVVAVNGFYSFIIIYVIGLALAVGAGFSTPILFIISLLAESISFAFAVKVYSIFNEKRELVIKRLLSIKREGMGLMNPASDERNYSEEFTIVSLAKDHIYPTQIHFYMPTSFNQDRERDFLERLNLIFGTTARWAPDRSNKDLEGFDYAKGVANMKQMKPIPSMAKWGERYVLNPDIAWSFFPIALSVENGVQLKGETPDDDEFVLGFDVNGAQSKLAKERNITIGPDVSAYAPMILISGATGGGKAMEINEKVQVLVNDEEKEE